MASYPLVYEKYSAALTKPVELIAVKESGELEIHSYDGMKGNPWRGAMLSMLRSNPRKAIFDVLSLGSMNPLLCEWRYYSDVSDDEFRGKLNIVKSVKQSDIDGAYKSM